MTFEELKNFITHKMRLSHIYQPLLIKTLLDCGGTSTIRQMAVSFLSKDESQIAYYEKILKNMPIKVLAKHGVLAREDNLIKLNAKDFTLEQKAELIKLCEIRMQEYISLRGIAIWGHRLLETDPAPDPLPGGRGLKDFCPFCLNIKNHQFLVENDYCLAIPDKFPVTEDHTLVIPKRHFKDYFETTETELLAINRLLAVRKKQLTESDKTIAGFNIGVNSGEVSGQTVEHCHVHLIPRRSGDTENPFGGVRGVIPEKQKYF